ncbi:MAG: glycine--tRNA ligase [Candidatus Muiribacterium halophilum]|uniref:Glycine--tRNA ligase n=1 Tax=Muiribacterium halophilum TaxID=2053465 RepID=A0A2N5ZB60_MUIH1|nr:MAG: glycine--tRNA ligase [Candidatus Muirbacterium halophilum]
MDIKDMQTIVSLAKRRGFIFQSSEIYGGINSCWDYGPYGVSLKRNVKDAWWKDNVSTRTDMVGLDSSILMAPRIWEASGHLSNFSDPMVDCKECKLRYRADDIDFDKCPECGGEFTEPRQFNLMFKTFMGPIEDSSNTVYLRPETAQGIFVNFKNVTTTSRKRVPFGIAQIGKSFRNEITPGNFTFRTREFEQMEIEFFCEPEKADEFYEYWKNRRFEWYKQLGIREENLQLREHASDELAHYARGCADVEYRFPFGFAELEGIANRTDYDLKQHMEFSGRDLSYMDPMTNKKYVPYVIEPSAGADRATLAFLIDAYREEEVDGDTRSVMKFHHRLAPVKVAVFQLMKKPPLKEKAEAIFAEVVQHFEAEYYQVGSIGKRYRRQDEIGTPYCVTIDFDTLEDNTITIRDRDSMEQERINADTLVEYLKEKMS